jgi:hypothetical protein
MEERNKITPEEAEEFAARLAKGKEYTVEKNPDKELVEITMKFSKRFVDIMDRSIAQLEKTYDIDLDYGTYLEQAMSDLVETIVLMERSRGYKPPDDDNPMHG